MRGLFMKGKMLVVIFAVLLIVIGGASALIWYYNSDYRYKNADCGEFPEDERNLCCSEKHKGEVTIQCTGGWEYIEESKDCSFVCRLGEPVFCTADVKECRDGSFVPRDPENGCAFKPCP